MPKTVQSEPLASVEGTPDTTQKLVPERLAPAPGPRPSNAPIEVEVEGVVMHTLIIVR